MRISHGAALLGTGVLCASLFGGVNYRYEQPLAQTGRVVTATSRLIVRREASAQAEPVARLSRGAIVDVIDQTNPRWYGVRLADGRTGWVGRLFIALQPRRQERPAPSAAPTAAPAASQPASDDSVLDGAAWWLIGAGSLAGAVALTLAVARVLRRASSSVAQPLAWLFGFSTSMILVHLALPAWLIAGDVLLSLSFPYAWSLFVPLYLVLAAAVGYFLRRRNKQKEPFSETRPPLLARTPGRVA